MLFHQGKNLANVTICVVYKFYVKYSGLLETWLSSHFAKISSDQMK
jgi:hypothetical protein